MEDAARGREGHAPPPASESAGALTVDGEELNGDLSREAARKQARRLFYAGFAGLPALWLVNAWFFWPAVRRRHPASAYDHEVTTYATWSLALGVLFSAFAASWTLTFWLGGPSVVGQGLWDKLAVSRLDLGLDAL